MNQVTLPVDIPPHSCQIKHQRNPLPLYPPNNSPQVFHQHHLLRTNHWSLFWLLLILPVFSPVPFPVLVPQIYSSLKIHMYYTALLLQDLISCHLLFQTLSFSPQNSRQCPLQNNYPKTQSLLPSHPQVLVHLQLQIHFVETYIIPFQTTLYKTSKFTSLVLYPNLPYLRRYHFQFYLTNSFTELVIGGPQHFWMWISSKKTSWVDVRDKSCSLSYQYGSCLISTSSLL